LGEHPDRLRSACLTHIRRKFERYAKVDYKVLGTLTKKALKYIKTEWPAMQTILQDGNLELSNNLAEQMMRHIKMNLKNCLNIGSEDSALDYAFMYSVLESCGMNKLSPGWYIKELVARLTAKQCNYVEKEALFALLHKKINVKIYRFLFLTLVESPLNKGGSRALW